MPELPRILVLGATGFLGRHIRAALEGDGRTGAVVGVARTVPAPAAAGRADWHALDLVGAGPEGLGALLRGVRPDVVVNAAGATSGTDDELHALNVRAVGQLLAALTAWSPRARLVHLGSAAEYGPAVAGRPTLESDEPRPVGPYGRTKLAGTLAVLDAAGQGADTVVLRVFNPIGAGVDPATMPGAAARRMAAALAAGERRIAMGPLGAHRDFVAAADVASAVVAAVHAGTAATGEVLNVGSGHARPARDLVRALAATAGYTGVVDEADEGRGSGRSASVSWSEADLGRIATVLGWRPSVPFADAVADLWAGVVSGRQGWPAAARSAAGAP